MVLEENIATSQKGHGPPTVAFFLEKFFRYFWMK